MDQELATRSALTKPYLTFILVSLTGFLTACGNSSIEAVKNLPLQSDESYTVGQAYDNRAVCEDISWSNFEDDKGRNIVEYRCELKGYKEHAEKSLTLLLSQAENQKQADLKMITEKTAELKEGFDRIDHIIDEVQKERDRFAISKNYDDLAFYLKTIDSAEENSTKKFTYKPGRLRNITNWCINSPNRDSDSYCQSLPGEIDAYLSELKRYNENWQAGIDKNNQLELTVKSQTEEKINAYKQNPILTSDQAFEVQQWTVKDEKPVFIGATLEYQSGDKKDSAEIYDIVTLERAILASDVNDYEVYSKYFF